MLMMMMQLRLLIGEYFDGKVVGSDRGRHHSAATGAFRGATCVTMLFSKRLRRRVVRSSSSSSPS